MLLNATSPARTQPVLPLAVTWYHACFVLSSRQYPMMLTLLPSLSEPTLEEESEWSL